MTGVAPPQGGVPARPALAVKVDNAPDARPQYGLGAADVVYEEPVEGGLTRFIVIFQCHDAPRVEPIRSGRLIDPIILSQFGAHPLMAYSGGIGPAVAAIDSSSIIDIGVSRAPLSAYYRDSARVAPHNLASSTATLYAVGTGAHAPPTPPAPVFSFGSLPQVAQPAASVNVGYQYGTVVWTWNAGGHVWSRSYARSGPATLGEGGQMTATNVVVMKVVLYPSPYVEDPTGAHENLLVLTGSGPVQIFRDGSVVNGTWNRQSMAAITSYHDASGNPIPLSPGNTWVELVPTTLPVTVTP